MVYAGRGRALPNCSLVSKEIQATWPFGRGPPQTQAPTKQLLPSQKGCKRKHTQAKALARPKWLSPYKKGTARDSFSLSVHSCQAGQVKRAHNDGKLVFICIKSSSAENKFHIFVGTLVTFNLFQNTH